ncbi:MAG: hypothetical protein IJY47_01435 [Clostridia bacterium]|nr:hypothetical protein [Clostridia bacterium]
MNHSFQILLHQLDESAEKLLRQTDHYLDSVLSQQPKDRFFTSVDIRSFSAEYYSHAVILAREWEKCRYTVCQLVRELQEADRLGDEKLILLEEKVFNEFLSLEATLQSFFKESENMIHSGEKEIDVSRIAHAVPPLRHGLHSLRRKIGEILT